MKLEKPMRFKFDVVGVHQMLMLDIVETFSVSGYDVEAQFFIGDIDGRDWLCNVADICHFTDTHADIILHKFNNGLITFDDANTQFASRYLHNFISVQAQFLV
tara:strand:+ start:519 stop:827 length:309 start_codon:yes stop_codon:yes gene_type:complete